MSAAALYDYCVRELEILDVLISHEEVRDAGPGVPGAVLRYWKACRAAIVRRLARPDMEAEWLRRNDADRSPKGTIIPQREQPQLDLAARAA